MTTVTDNPPESKTKRRDMSKAEFATALKRYGIESQGALGYYAVTKCVHVSVWNAPDQSYRGKLKYLLKEQARAERENAKAASRLAARNGAIS